MAKKTNFTFAGDLTPQQAWNMLQENPKAVLIDVRTNAEFAYVGNPDLTTLNKDVVQVYWQVFPAMDVNPEFATLVENAIAD